MRARAAAATGPPLDTTPRFRAGRPHLQAESPSPSQADAQQLSQKTDFLKKVDENPKKEHVDLAKELGIAPSMLCTIVGQRDAVLKNAQHFGGNVKQAKTATHVKLEEVLLTWFREVTEAVVNVDGKITGPDAVPTGVDEEPDEDLVIEGWKSLKTEASAQDFVTADDNVATCGLRSIEDLVDEVNEV
ncbi:hypothetical protein HPB52_005276 [Rhipicephalus sanguineus]|uniref:Uncharacterized protein n=1 Tax=Rhipicephalus sanguineus TaxID=34632 RepID=A0A9D4QI90_RHISA|nr:hypothetical protein HPB52_005276 [Rhipicephalus sanguineus]